MHVHVHSSKFCCFRLALFRLSYFVEFSGAQLDSTIEQTLSITEIEKVFEETSINIYKEKVCILKTKSQHTYTCTCKSATSVTIVYNDPDAHHYILC